MEVDRLPKGNESRTVETSKGEREISLADGYRVMVAYNDKKDWFANIKAEKSFDADLRARQRKCHRESQVGGVND